MKPLRINERLTIPAESLIVQQVRSSGPGGQNVNKVATKIVLSWTIDSALLGSSAVESRLRALAGHRLVREHDLQIVCQQTRSADRNLRLALQQLRQLLLEAFERPKPRLATRPSGGSIRRRLEEKSQTSQRKAGRQQPKWD